jgi:hypothetical protein
MCQIIIGKKYDTAVSIALKLKIAGNRYTSG